MSREVQVHLGYDGVVYADKMRKELLDKKIEVLEIELARLKELRKRRGGASDRERGAPGPCLGPHRRQHREVNPGDGWA